MLISDGDAFASDSSAEVFGVSCDNGMNSFDAVCRDTVVLSVVVCEAKELSSAGFVDEGSEGLEVFVEKQFLLTDDSTVGVGVQACACFSGQQQLCPSFRAIVISERPSTLAAFSEAERSTLLLVVLWLLSFDGTCRDDDCRGRLSAADLRRRSVLSRALADSSTPGNTMFIDLDRDMRRARCPTLWLCNICLTS